MTSSGDHILDVSYATASVEAVAAFAAAHYDLGDGPLSCALLNRGFNDTYGLRTSAGESLVLRLSGHRARGPADVAAETEFLAYLDAVGVPVAAAVPTRSGALFTSARLPDGPRAVVLFRHAEGRRPELDAPEDARSQGVTLAQLHSAADRYPARMAGRYTLDLAHSSKLPGIAAGFAGDQGVVYLLRIPKTDVQVPVPWRQQRQPALAGV